MVWVFVFILFLPFTSARGPAMHGLCLPIVLLLWRAGLRNLKLNVSFLALLSGAAHDSDPDTKRMVSTVALCIASHATSSAYGRLSRMHVGGSRWRIVVNCIRSTKSVRSRSSLVYSHRILTIIVSPPPLQVQQIIDSNVHIRRQYYAQERAKSGIGMRSAALMYIHLWAQASL